MMPIHPTRPNVFAQSPLDRRESGRRDADWVGRQLDDPGTVFLPVWRGKNLVDGEASGPAMAFLPADHARSRLHDAPWALLGMRDGHAHVAIDLSAQDDPLPPGSSGRFEDLRRIGGLLSEQEASLLAHARGLMHWRTRHRYCGVCGAASLPRSAGHVMVCQGCGTQHFPRTDPAVIMLVTNGGRSLLGHPARFAEQRMFTTLAGFVEPGESLEEAVAREVLEETAVRVGNVRYRSSQPWPFPASLMLGFTAEAEDDPIMVDRHELVEARWFTRAEVLARQDFVIPPPLSIARRLIEDWLNE